MNFKQADITRYLKTPDPNIKCVLIHGTNIGMMNDYANSFARTVCSDLNDAFTVASLDMEKINSDAGTLYAEYNARSLMGGRRVVFVKDATNDIKDPLKQMLATSTSDTLLILISTSINTKSSLFTWAKDAPEFALISCYDDRENDLRTLAGNYLAKNNVTITNDAMELLCSRLSADRQASLGELDKLITYLGTRRHIEIKDIQLLISDTSDSSFEDLCFFVAGGEPDKAMDAYAELLFRGEEPATITRSLSAHFWRLLGYASKVQKGEYPKQVIENLKPKPIFYRKDDLIRQLRIWNTSAILSALNALNTCERDCKTTNMPTDEVLGQNVMRLANWAKRTKSKF